MLTKQSSFSRGEISPFLYDRSELQQYFTSLKKARNVNIHLQGAISNRAGSLHIAKLDGKENCRVVNFTYNRYQSYVLVFYSLVDATGGNSAVYDPNAAPPDHAVYFDVYSNNMDLIQERIETIYSREQIQELYFNQSGDFLFCYHSENPINVIKRKDNVFSIEIYPLKENYTISDNSIGLALSYKNPDFILYASDEFFTEDKLNVEISLSKQIFAQDVSIGITGNGESVDMYLSNGDFSFKTSGDSWKGDIQIMRSYNNQNWETVKHINTNVSNTNFDFTYEGDGKICFYKFTYNITSGTCNFYFNVHTFELTLLLQISSIINLFSAKVNVKNYIEGLEAYFVSYEDATIVPIIPPMTSNTTPYGTVEVLSGTLTTNAYGCFGQNGDVKFTENSIAKLKYTFRKPVTITSINYKLSFWGTFNVTHRMYFYSETRKDYIIDEHTLSNNHPQRITYTLSATNENIANIGHIILELTPNYNEIAMTIRDVYMNGIEQTDGEIPDYIYKWGEKSSSFKNGYPSCGSFVQDRHIIAATIARPSGVWLSETGAYDNFYVDYANDISDTSPIDVDIPVRKISKIYSLTLLNEIIALSSDNETVIGTANGTMTPSTITLSVAGNNGNENVKPVVVDNLIVAVQKGGLLKAMKYDFQSDNYISSDLRLFSEHFFEGYNIVGLEYIINPDRTIYCVRSDGKLLKLNYMQDQEFFAWSMDTYPDNITSICECEFEGYNYLWAVCGDNLIRLEKRIMHGKSDEICFLDNATKIVDSDLFTGIEYLNGKQVMAQCCDYSGNMWYEEGTVANGTFRISKVAKIAYVGLSYLTEIETLSIALAQQPALNITKGRIAACTLSLIDSLGIQVGTRDGEQEFMNQVEFDGGDKAKLSTGASLFTGYYDIPLYANNTIDKSLIIKQYKPFPFTVRSITNSFQGTGKIDD